MIQPLHTRIALATSVLVVGSLGTVSAVGMVVSQTRPETTTSHPEALGVELAPSPAAAPPARATGPTTSTGPAPVAAAAHGGRTGSVTPDRRATAVRRSPAPAEPVRTIHRSARYEPMHHLHHGRQYRHHGEHRHHHEVATAAGRLAAQLVGGHGESRVLAY